MNTITIVNASIIGFEQIEKEKNVVKYQTKVQAKSETNQEERLLFEWQIPIRYSVYRQFYLRLCELEKETFKKIDFPKRGTIFSSPSPKERQKQLDFFLKKAIKMIVSNTKNSKVQVLVNELFDVSSHVEDVKKIGNKQEQEQARLSLQAVEASVIVEEEEEEEPVKATEDNEEPLDNQKEHDNQLEDQVVVEEPVVSVDEVTTEEQEQAEELEQKQKVVKESVKKEPQMEEPIRTSAQTTTSTEEEEEEDDEEDLEEEEEEDDDDDISVASSTSTIESAPPSSNNSRRRRQKNKNKPLSAAQKKARNQKRKQKRKQKKNKVST